MAKRYLDQLTRLVSDLLKQPAFNNAISKLKEQVGTTEDPFVWSVIDPDLLPDSLPGELKSGWIFVLKEGVSSGCHYHPNSVQHMLVLDGQGTSTVGGYKKRMFPFGSTQHQAEDLWFVINEGVEHEFVPEGRYMVVISFHTCVADELEEVAFGTGNSRLYEGK